MQRIFGDGLLGKILSAGSSAANSDKEDSDVEDNHSNSNMNSNISNNDIDDTTYEVIKSWEGHKKFKTEYADQLYSEG